MITVRDFLCSLLTSRLLPMNENSEPLDERKPARTEIRGGDKPSDYFPGELPAGADGSGYVGWDDDEDDFPEYELP